MKILIILQTLCFKLTKITSVNINIFSLSSNYYKIQKKNYIINNSINDKSLWVCNNYV